MLTPRSIFSRLMLLGLAVNASPAVLADDASDHAGFLSLGFENDVFLDRDRHYTAGQRIAYTSPVGKALMGGDRWARVLPFVADGDKIRSQLTLSQHIFTADDISIANPGPGTRPYGGWLNLDYALLAIGDDHLDSWSFGVGITGEASLAGRAQRALHDILPDQIDPAGWKTQVPTEPSFQLRYDRVWFISADKDALGWAPADFQPRFSVSAGTALSMAQAGFIARVGNRLSQEPGPEFLAPTGMNVSYFRPADKGDINWYGFFGGDARFVAHNMFLDGGTFRSSRAEPRKDFVFDAMAGVVVTASTWRLSFGLVHRTKEFDAQTSDDRFGIVQLSIKL